MKKVAIIAGAGPAGLTAAYELLEHTDVHPIVFESSDAIGGIAQTYNYKGNRIDIGGHRFFSKSDRVMKWWFDRIPLQGSPAADTIECGHDVEYLTGGPDPEKEDIVMLQRPRLSHILYRRYFFPYPIGITFTVASRLGFWNTFLIGLSYIKAQLFPQKNEEYLDAFLTNRFGRRLYETFFKDYTEKVWGVPCKRIRADWGAQRIKGLSLKRAVEHAIKDLISSDFKKAQAERETSLITRFYYPKYGPGQMWEVVAKKVQDKGGDVRIKKRVVGVHLANPEQDQHSKFPKIASVIIEDMRNGEREEIECDYFFSTMPIKDLMRMIDPSPPSDVLRVSDGLVYRDFITVGLLLTRLSVGENGKLSDNWIYVQEGDVKVGRIQIFNNWSPYLVQNKNSQWIGLEYFVNEGDELWSLSDDDLKDLGISELEKIGFASKEDLLDGCVLRMPKTYPAYFGTYDDIGKVKDYTLGIPNLYLIGRNGLHRYNNQDHSMLTAMTAVDNIVEGRTDNGNIWEINEERVYHEEREQKS